MWNVCSRLVGANLLVPPVAGVKSEMRDLNRKGRNGRKGATFGHFGGAGCPLSSVVPSRSGDSVPYEVSELTPGLDSLLSWVSLLKPDGLCTILRLRVPRSERRA